VSTALPSGREALRTGLERAVLPGRFQVVRDGSDNGAALVLDGAHNEDGARVLQEAISATFP
jgi:dihydrofolate synthase/folylpolyglutamate synthase